MPGFKINGLELRPRLAPRSDGGSREQGTRSQHVIMERYLVPGTVLGSGQVAADGTKCLSRGTHILGAKVTTPWQACVYVRTR